MTLKLLTSLSVLGGLLGCSTFTPGGPTGQAGTSPRSDAAAVAQTPNQLQSAALTVDSVYALARQAQASGHLKIAAQRYERVLAMQPTHVGALQGLAVILAQEGHTPRALELFARAGDLEPTSAHIHNNMGYTLLRAERLDEAEVALKKAQALQPDSAHTRMNLELLALARADQQARQPLAPAALGATNQADPPSPVVVAVAPNVFELRPSSAPDLPLVPAQAQASVPVIAPSTVPAPVTAQAVAPVPVPVVLADPPAVFALESPTMEPATVVPAQNREAGYQLVLNRDLAQQSGPFAIWTDIRGVKLEVSNGVGIHRMAKHTAVRLADQGVATARLTNARPFRQARTQLQYLPGQQTAVKALAARLPVPVELVQVNNLNAKMQLRLVLGHDMAGRAIAAWVQGGPILATAPNAVQQRRS